MLLSYQECLEKYGTGYKIKKCVQEGELYVKENGYQGDKASAKVCQDIQI